MNFKGTETIDIVGKLMGLKKDYVNCGKMYIPQI
jgi:hypothetical protein